MSKKIIKIEPEFLVDFLQSINDPRIDRTKNNRLEGNFIRDKKHRN